MLTNPHHDSHNTTDLKPEIEFEMNEDMNTALRMHMCVEKETIFGKYNLTIVKWAERNYRTWSLMPNHIPTLLHTPLCNIFH